MELASRKYYQIRYNFIQITDGLDSTVRRNDKVAGCCASAFDLSMDSGSAVGHHALKRCALRMGPSSDLLTQIGIGPQSPE
jgi:hypothetical protein